MPNDCFIQFIHANIFLNTYGIIKERIFKQIEMTQSVP